MPSSTSDFRPLPALVAIAIALMPLVIYLMYPPEIKATPDAVSFARERLGYW